jgi:hypothetical protein
MDRLEKTCIIGEATKKLVREKPVLRIGEKNVSQENSKSWTGILRKH